MATSGSKETGYYGGVRGLKFNWWQNNQSIEGNYTDIGWNFVGCGYNSGTWYYTKNGYVNINDNRVFTQADYKHQVDVGSVLASGTARIYHGSDGKKTFNANGGATIFYYDQWQTFSENWALTQIPRVSEMTLSATELNVGEEITINTNRKSTSFTHKLYYSINDEAEVCLSSNITDSYTWQIPKNIANKITSGVSKTMKFRLVTVNNGNTIGSNEKTITVKVPNTSEFKPSISNVALSEIGVVPTSWGFYVKDESKIRGVISAGGAYGSTINFYSVAINGESFSSSTFETSIITSVNPTLKITVKDSRGRSASYQATVVVVDYKVPTITNFLTYRRSSNQSKIDVTFSCQFYPLSDKNPIAFKYYYRRSTDESYTLFNIPLSGLTKMTSGNKYIYSGTVAVFTSDTSQSYDAYMEAIDTFKTVPSLHNFINTVSRLINISANRKYLALGKIHEVDGYNEMATPEIHYDNIYRNDGDYNGIVLSCPSILNGKLNYVSDNNSLEFTIGGTSYGITIWASDERLKKNIRLVKKSYIDKIEQIQHIKFKYKDGKKTIPIGYSANQLKEIDDSFVIETGEDKTLQPNISVLIPVITKAMQELIERVEKLERNNNK